jgi:acetyl-CoA/propionyl-CoA carboxylase biotin carboxyl carrier protein
MQRAYARGYVSSATIVTAGVSLLCEPLITRVSEFTANFYVERKIQEGFMFKKVLIANRGEIAVRVIRACQEMEIKTVAVFSEPDRPATHVRIADEAWLLEGQPGKVYLDIPQIIEVAKRAQAEAIHPGYGFLAENSEFAAACAAAGLVFIGPAPDVIRKMGSKIESRRIMEAAGVPVVPGNTDPITDVETVKKLCTKYGYPVAIKASAGGGGRGLRVVRKEEEVEQALAGAQREGSSYFGSAEVYLEKYLDHPRHIEVQVIGDSHGNVIHLFERDCSTQRRHQKLVEESPAPGLNPDVRRRLLENAVKGAKAIGYTSAGTVECLVSGNDFYFLEMNTRVQVEHPITEFITGVDIVKEQIRVAAGEKLSVKQEDVVARGHAIECRVNAEDPFKQFMPSPGTVTVYKEPHLPWVRIDSACYPGYQILPFYDSLLAKLVCWGRTREEAIARTKLALKNFEIVGVSTTNPFHLMFMDDPTFLKGEVYTGYVEGEFRKNLQKPPAPAAENKNGSGSIESAAVAAVERTEPRSFEVEVNQKHFRVSVKELVPVGAGSSNGGGGAVKSPAAAAAARPVARSQRPVAQTSTAGGSGEVRSSMHGLVKQLLVEEGAKVTAGQRLVIFEAMKMESEILADRAGTVASIKVKQGETVEAKQLLMVIGD